MSSLQAIDRSKLERLFKMSEGYVLGFSDADFGQFFGDFNVDIHSAPYCSEGRSKAKKLQMFWKLESDHLVGQVIAALIEYRLEYKLANTQEELELVDACQEIASRLLSMKPNLTALNELIVTFDANYLSDQIRRMSDAIDSDPSLAIGTAKDLIETCCKTILAERGKPVSGTPDIPALTKETLKELNLVPEGIDEGRRGSDVVKNLLRSLGTIGKDLGELRNLYGTGHGKRGSFIGLTPRHAKLAVGAAATFVTFLFETHMETKHRLSR